MAVQIVLLIIIVIFLLINLLVLLFRKNKFESKEIDENINRLQIQLSSLDPLIRNELSTNRNEQAKNSKGIREEVSGSIKGFTEILTSNIGTLSKMQSEQFNELKDSLKNSLLDNDKKIEKLIKNFDSNIKTLIDDFKKSSVENRKELSDSLEGFEKKLIENIKSFNELQRTKFGDLTIRTEELKKSTEKKLEVISETVSTQLQKMSEGNMKKLEEMRKTVDEKLHSTLEKRFNDSFTIISKRLEEVHKGLGEMQSLAINVGDLKRVMTNVKSRGVIGEYQLANLLEDLLTNDQYSKNVKTKKGSGAIVEFAIKMPNRNDLEKTLWLPIDSKFPKEDYERLVEAYDDGNPELIESLRKKFKNSIIKSAKDIKEKYIDPPNTTEYGIMFLPFESLFAEVLRTPGLFEKLQKEYKVTITGPTTFSALLNSLQMGFRTLAIEKRTSHVWDLLNTIKKEFGQFGTVLEKTKKKLQEASNVIDQASTRSRVIERNLKKVQTLPAGNRNDLESGEIFEEIEDMHIEDLDNDNIPV